MQKMLLPDVNVWIALAINSHAHHHSAKTWFLAQADQSLLFCRMTQQGFLRLISNPQLTSTGVRTLAEAWQAYDVLLSDKRVGFVAEPVGVEAVWRGFTQHNTFSPKLWNDAYLAAFASISGLELVSFDRAFAQFAGLKFTMLT